MSDAYSKHYDRPRRTEYPPVERALGKLATYIAVGAMLMVMLWMCHDGGDAAAFSVAFFAIVALVVWLCLCAVARAVRR